MYPESLKRLIETFKLFPGIGEKTAERLAFSVLEMESEQVEYFSKSLLDAKNNIRKCEVCNIITEKQVCDICSDKTRENRTLCIVEDSKYAILIEKLGVFNGKYHILDGLISPLDGINPEDIGLEKLVDRILKDKFDEIIIAFKPSIEGETTALYIKKILSDIDVKVTKLASGLPIGVDMEYVDSLTLECALKDRKVIE